MGHPAHADVTVCIPAWRAAAFIDRTMRCARNQTHDAQRITVSIDLSDDGTEEICRRHAREDDRVEVHAQRERLGWAGNVNFLLDSVRTEFAFLYFHDDLIEPTYTERLVAALRARPDAASAHCDMRHFGGVDTTVPGRSYEGSAAERLLTFLVVKKRGALLRSMLRTRLVGAGLRLSNGSSAGISGTHLFLLKLVAAGPAVHVEETLYRRWAERQGGLTHGWQSLRFDELLAEYRVTAAGALEIIEGLRPSPQQREYLIFGLFVFMTHLLRRAEFRNEVPSVQAPERVLPEFAGMTMTPSVRGLPPPLGTWCEEAYDRVLRQTARRALRVGDYTQAATALEASSRPGPAEVRVWRRLAEALRDVGRWEDAEQAERHVRRLRRTRSVRPADSAAGNELGT
jgi:hypothetical protein